MGKLSAVAAAVAVVFTVYACSHSSPSSAPQTTTQRIQRTSGGEVVDPNARNLAEGRRVFRHETFGDERFWGDELQLHLAIAGSKYGGVGPGVTPKQALAAG